MTREKPHEVTCHDVDRISNLRHNTSPTIACGAFVLVPQAPSPQSPPTVSTLVTSIASLQRNNRRTGRPDASFGVFNVSPAHSHRDPSSFNYGLWSFDDRSCAIACDVTNNMVNTSLSLLTPLLTEDARRQDICIVAAAVIFVNLPNTASDGTLPPSKYLISSQPGVRYARFYV